MGLCKPLTPEQIEEVYKQMFTGKPLVDICDYLGVSRQALHHHGKRDPAFAQRVKEIREETAHDLVDSLRNITVGCETMVDVNVARLKSDNAKWEASRRNPAAYGDRLDVNVQTLDLTAVLNAASSRVLPMLQGFRDVGPGSSMPAGTDAQAVADEADQTDHDTDLSELI